jgi:putative ABC transport system permease protein
MTLLAIAGSMALLLSAVGIYGVISYLVSQRRSEIGVRVALGARMPQVAGLVLGQSMRLAVLGVSIGLVAAVLGMRVLKSLLFEVSPTDPVVLAGTACILVVIAAVASVAPTRRAAKIDPVEAMRG